MAYYYKTKLPQAYIVQNLMKQNQTTQQPKKKHWQLKKSLAHYRQVIFGCQTEIFTDNNNITANATLKKD